MLSPVDVTPPLSKAFRYSSATDLRCSSVMTRVLSATVISSCCENAGTAWGRAPGPTMTGPARRCQAAGAGAESDSAKRRCGSVSTSRSASPAAARSARSRGDVDVHAPLGAQAHLDPLALAVVERHVVERVDVEVGAQLAVDHAQHVAVELRGDAGAVVVGRFDHGGVLHQIRPQQEVV